jgi:SAM-dependent methyltransferase
LRKNIAPLRLDKNVILGKFTPKTAFAERFDLVIMSHCVYWFVPDIKGHLKNALRLLNKKGKLVIYLQTFATFACALNTFLRAKDPLYPHQISSRDIAQVLDGLKISYRVSYLPGTLRADDLFRPGNKKLLDDIISFCLFTEAMGLSVRDLRFAEDLVRLLSYKTDKGVKLNLSVAAITITK